MNLRYTNTLRGTNYRAGQLRHLDPCERSKSRIGGPLEKGCCEECSLGAQEGSCVTRLSSNFAAYRSAPSRDVALANLARNNRIRGDATIA
jgi:hypothetical protein